jgi:hypothetical protein
MRSHFEDFGNPLAYHFKADGHWNNEGHKRAAETLYERISPELMIMIRANKNRRCLWIQLLSAPFGLCDKTKVNRYISFAIPHAPRRGAYEGVYSVDPPPKVRNIGVA